MTKRNSLTNVFLFVALAMSSTPGVAGINFEKLFKAFSDTCIMPYSYVFPQYRTVGPRKGLQVIGAGFPRTGTQSLDAALNDIGHHVYRLDEVLRTPTHMKRWVKAARDWKENDDLTEVEKLLNEVEDMGYTATLDFPMYLFAPAFAKLRPEAKAIQSVRDSADRWVPSWIALHHVLSFTQMRPWKWLLAGFDLRSYGEEYCEIFIDYFKAPKLLRKHIARPLPWFEYLETHPADTPEWFEVWKNWYIRTNQEFKEEIPEHQMITFNVREGWAPLVDFLGLDPALKEEAFPNVNDRQNLAIVRTTFDILGVLFPFWVGGILYLIYMAVTKAQELINGGDKNKSKTKSV